MRRTQKKQIENLMILLEQAHHEIGNLIQKKNIPIVLELLADCQAGAISAGELIEQSEGENAPIIKEIEEYCETVYQIHNKLLKDPFSDINSSYRMLQKSFFKMKRYIGTIKEHLEIVFLPYKASMWDSLESVWRAADQDENCDAYVIPIPYYDKNPDGSLGELHDEANLYPDDVPVLQTWEYDFEKRRPDMILIHNPYDEYNYVTSVAPFFYSKNLKQFTDQLVYIPYFILDDIDPDDEKAVDEIAHFCTLPGVIYADWVIVQSENMRQAYIKALLKNSRNREVDREYWEHKILGIGSPKIDKIQNIKKEDLKIPKEWLDVIQKPSGEFKTVILYNTSVGALLRHGEKMIEKIQKVFQIFKESQKETVLLWRPHPLILATIESMRPQLWNQYQKIVEQYKAEEWGIYDDSPELDRALILSDGYYGDPSSLVQLCRSIGMPVMIQDVAI